MKNTFLFLVSIIIVLILNDSYINASTKETGFCHSSGYMQMKASSIHCINKNTNCCKAGKIYPKFQCSPPITSNTEAIMIIKSFTTAKGVMRPISHNSHTNNNGAEMNLDGVRHNAVTSVDIDAKSDIGSDNGGEMSLDGVRQNPVASVDSGSNSTDGNRSNVVSSIDSGSSSADGSRHNIITGINSGSTNKSRMSVCRNDRHHNDNEMIVKLSTGWYNGGTRCLKKVRINWKGKSVLAKVVGECDSVNGCDSGNGYRVPCPSNVVVASPAVWKALGVRKLKYPKLKITWSDA